MSGHTIILRGPAQRGLAAKMVEQAPVDTVVTFKPLSRTIDQNARMWSVLTEISIAKPEGRRATPDTWKALFMHACGHAVQFEVGLDDALFPTGFSTSKLTKAQMSDLLEFMNCYAAEHGIVLKEKAWPDSR